MQLSILILYVSFLRSPIFKRRERRIIFFTHSILTLKKNLNRSEQRECDLRIFCCVPKFSIHTLVVNQVFLLISKHWNILISITPSFRAVTIDDGEPQCHTGNRVTKPWKPENLNGSYEPCSGWLRGYGTTHVRTSHCRPNHRHENPSRLRYYFWLS